MEDKKQKINCTVESCKYNDYNRNICELNQIHVQACTNCSKGKPEDESMCGSYVYKHYSKK